MVPALDKECLISSDESQTYRSIIGGLLYLAVSPGLHLSFPVSALARQVYATTGRQIKMVKRLLRYLNDSSRFGSHDCNAYGITAQSLVASGDADWGECINSRLSTSGFMVDINGSPVFFKSKLQTAVESSSGEA